MLNFRENSRPFGRRTLRIGAVAVASALSFCGTAAGAQELVHTFLNPSFGGNPFYSSHLLATAEVSRPKAPTTTTPAPTQDELIASTLRAQLLSSLSSDILNRIQNAKPGDSGDFTLGDQRISFTKTTTATTITFTNPNTGKTSQVVIPASGTSGNTTFGLAAVPVTAEQALSASSSSASTTTSSTSLSPTSLLSLPPL